MSLELSLAPLMNACGKTSVTYTSKVEGYDSTTRMNTTTDTTHEFYVLKSSYNANEVSNSGGLIRQDDVKVIADATDITFTPTMVDTITISSTEYEIVNYKAIDLGTDTIAWIFQLRC